VRQHAGSPWRLAVAAVAATVAIAALACDEGGSQAPPARAPGETATAAIPGRAQQVTLHGVVTLDAAPPDAQFLGARVVRDGLVTACQNVIPRVTQGRYEITVAADAEVRGCGAPGAEVVLWIYTDRFVFSSSTIEWPGDSATVEFDASFSTLAPAGASKPVTEFKGHLYDRDGAQLPPGSVVEAYIGPVRCGVTSLRYGEQNERFYTLAVVGPDSVPGCHAGAQISFRLDGRPATQTAVNDFGAGRDPDQVLDLIRS
jgi:hypothetical protein